MGGVTDFLLELRSEEIPARMQGKAKDDLARLFAEALAKSGLAAADVETFATPRRLALIAKGLPLETEAVSEETKGPKVGAPPQALEGFLRKTGLTQDQLVERDGIYFAVVEKPGQKTADVLAEAIPAFIRAFPWPKSQRWGAASAIMGAQTWVRPLQGIVAIFGDEVVPARVVLSYGAYVEDGGVVIDRSRKIELLAGSTTTGHRFHSKGPIEIANAAAYVETMRAAHVIVHFSERCQIIRECAAKAAADAGLVLVEDEGLVAENAGLTEWPVPMLGRFDLAFLAVPEEVIQLTARVNQKYFVCHDSAGKLANAFVCTANIVANDGGAAIVAGNEKVLAARLSDAKFFWEQDLKIKLDTQAEKLSQITFHEKLGTVADKVDRVAKLARWLVEEGIVKGDPDQAERAARLCKADLVTGMVGEFPELQGIMGGYYARAQGEPDAVADAVRDHYKPVGQGDDVPTAPVTVAVSLADKLDTLFSFFKVNLLPTGSKDPFALRRAALAYLQLMQVNSLVLHLQIAAQNWGTKTDGVLGLRLADFMFDRLGVQLRDVGVRHDFIQASRSWDEGSDTDGRIDRVEARSRALAAFLGTDEGTNLLAGYKRAANILKASPSPFAGEGGADAPGEGAAASAADKSFAAPSPSAAGAAPPSPAGGEGLDAERALESALNTAEPLATAAIETEDFEAAMSALASLRAPIDAFFEGVMVNDPDPQKRAYRLGLLTRFRDAVHRVADFSKIEG